MNDKNFYTLSERGTFHALSDTPCQDASAIQICGDIILIVVADGLGSKKLSKIGSELAIRYACRTFRNNGLISSKDLLLSVQRHLTKFAKKINLNSPNELATTFQIAILSEDKIDICICGDGAIVYTINDEHKIITDNQTHELANQTNHIFSENLNEKIFSKIIDSAVEHISLFSDGMRSVLVNEREGIAHKPIFNYFINFASEHCVEEAVKKLVNSKQVLESVYDDRSLASFVRVSR